jgi:hypothetical protein
MITLSTHLEIYSIAIGLHLFKKIYILKDSKQIIPPALVCKTIAYQTGLINSNKLSTVPSFIKQQHCMILHLIHPSKMGTVRSKGASCVYYMNQRESMSHKKYPARRIVIL